MKKFEKNNLVIVYSEKSDGDMKQEDNRQKFLTKLGLKYVYLPKQEHTSIVAPFVNISAPADGLYTDLKNIPLGVLTADCMAIVITDFKSLVVLHAGWRGLFKGIIENGIKFFRNKNGNLYSFISPSIKNCCFEVGKDFIEHLNRYNIDNRYLLEKNGKLFFSLQNLAIDKLKLNGVKDIEVADVCSKCENIIYSYRKGDIDKRIITLAYLR